MREAHRNLKQPQAKWQLLFLLEKKIKNTNIKEVFLKTQIYLHYIRQYLKDALFWHITMKIKH